MEVRGEAMISLPVFIIKKFGTTAYKNWLETLSPRAQKVYSSPLHKSDWYPLKEMMTEPTKKMCEQFYNKSMRGAWDCGRYSAEYGLKGVYKALVKLSSPKILIKRAAKILPSYYRPSKVEIAEETKNSASVRIIEFPEMDKYIEQRIAGWMERAVEITGCKHVTVMIAKTQEKYVTYLEYHISWKE